MYFGVLIFVFKLCIGNLIPWYLQLDLSTLDFEKSYDHINLDFLFVLNLSIEKMGFGLGWIAWIRFHISVVRFLFLVNGTSSCFF